MAKDTATRVAVRTTAAPLCAAPAVPADVANLLSQLSLSAHGPTLCRELGVMCASDLSYITDAMLKVELPALKPIERAKLVAAAAKLGGK